MPDNDPLLLAEEVAELLGISATTWRVYVSRRQPKRCPAPQPLDEDRLRDRDRNRPRWRRSSVIAWNARRPKPAIIKEEP